MKKISTLTAFFCLLFAAGAVFAQKNEALATNFTGTWELDVSKSKLPERMRVESGTLTVSHTGKQLTVATDFKRAPRSENPPRTDENGGMRPDGNRGMRRGGGMTGGGNGTVTYSLDGRETIIESETPAGMSPVTLSLKAETGKNGELKLTSNRSFESQMGAINVKTVETWELDKNRILKVTRETETLRGTQTSEMYFIKKVSLEGKTYEGKVVPEQVVNVPNGVSDDGMKNSSAAPASGNGQTPKIIKTGVINGKALRLVQPDYPPAARAIRATGAVMVEVTLDEQGKVISATAISGHPLLKAAAVEAARKSKFAPVMLDGVPVRVSGVIVYNFAP